MLRRQFRALIEMFQARLSAIQEAIQQHNALIHDAQESAEVQRREIPTTTASLIYSDLDRDRERADREQTHAEQQQLVKSQERTANWTIYACFSAIFYGAVAMGQGILMWTTYKTIERQASDADKTLGEIQKQTTFMRQQLIGTEGAQLSIKVGLDLENNVSIRIKQLRNRDGDGRFSRCLYRPRRTFDSEMGRKTGFQNCEDGPHSRSICF